jgi:hypothetical protein
MAEYAVRVQRALWRVLGDDAVAAAMTELSSVNCRSDTVHGARADIAGSIMCVLLPLPRATQGGNAARGFHCGSLRVSLVALPFKSDD